MMNLEKVGAHYAISSLFEAYAEQARIYCYTADRQDYRTLEAGQAKLVLGRAQLTAGITRESALLNFAVLHFGDHNLNGGVREFQGEEAYQTLVQEVAKPFTQADFPEVIRVLDKHFGKSTYSLKSLFRDEQRTIVNLILETSLAEAEAAYRQIYEHHAPLMRFLGKLGTPLPKAFQTAAEFVLNNNLRRAFESDDLNLERIATLLDSATREKVVLDAAGLSFTLEKALERMMERLRTDPTDLTLLQKLEAVIELTRSLPFTVNLWKAQNIYYQMLQSVYPEFRARTDRDAQAWVRHFISLGEKLYVRVASQ